MDMGESILRDRLVPFGGDFFVSPAYRKGIGLIFPNRDVAADGDVSEPGDAGGGPGKSSLFFLTARKPWNRIIRR